MKTSILLLGIMLLSACLSAQGDPFPNTPPQEQPTNPPPQYPQNPPPPVETTPAQKENNSPAKFKYNRLGVYTWRPANVGLDPNVDAKRKGIPTIYYSGGRDLLNVITFNVEMMFNWTQYEITTLTQQVETLTKSNYLAAGIGAQMEVKLPIIPSKKVEPYGQGSIGGLYQMINTSVEDLNFSYTLNMPGYYYSVGGGAIVYLNDGFGLFAEAGSFWYRSKDTQADIIDEILAENGTTGVSSADYGTPRKPFKTRDNYFKLGVVFKRPTRR